MPMLTREDIKELLAWHKSRAVALADSNPVEARKHEISITALMAFQIIVDGAETIAAQLEALDV